MTEGAAESINIKKNVVKRWKQIKCARLSNWYSSPYMKVEKDIRQNTQHQVCDSQPYLNMASINKKILPIVAEWAIYDTINP